MGGKKKTKWRKLPLAEFTKECPTTEKIVTKRECKPDLTQEEETQPPISSYEEISETTNQYSNEYGEYTDVSGMLYPTSYVVYNPVETPVYLNYMMPPADPCCYYYMPPEIAPVQEYTPVQYQDYAPPMKDTVYLLLPAPAVHSPHVAYDWRNRRRRRRYEGYAEYAVIPEKTTYSGNREEKERPRKLVPNTNLGRNDNQSSHTKTMTSVSETTSFNQEAQKCAQESTERSFIASDQQTKIMGLSNTGQSENIQEKQNFKPRKNQEFCGVHATRIPERKSSLNNSSEVKFQGKQNVPQNCGCDSHDGGSNSSSIELMDSRGIPNKLETMEKEKVTERKKNQNISKLSDASKTMDEATQKNTSGLIDTPFNSERTVLNISAVPENPLRNSAKETKEKDLLDSVQNSNSDVNSYKMTASDASLKATDNLHHKEIEETKNQNAINKQSSSPLPDILSTLHKNVPYNVKAINNETPGNVNKQTDYASFDKTPHVNEKVSKSTVILSQPPYVSHSLNSDTSSHDTEAELKRLTSLQSLKANQSIYKLAYDESITDQSESDSRSPSPVDPESQVPRSLTNDEILIYEADSNSDAGSEDVELIPHRYESETFLNESKHMYVNKLSLAVELLRTQESLPYDDQFKRVSGESNLSSKETNPNKTGEVNLGFVEDSSSFDSYEGLTDNHIAATSHEVVTNQSQPSKHSRNSGAISSFSFEDACNDSCEEAKEVVVEAANNRDDSEQVRAGYRRFQVQFRHYFSPRAALVNPCLCCVIM